MNGVATAVRRRRRAWRRSWWTTDLATAGDDVVEDGTHLPLQRRQPVLQRPARTGTRLDALHDARRAVLVGGDPQLLVVFLLGDLLEEAIEL